ncbi:DUF4167 domain-containing protein [Bartonella sp. B41]
MRPQQNRRVRGRNNNNNGNNNRRGPNPLSRNYESNGPDVKIRGSAQQIADKYISLARDAQGAGDRVMSENYLQHAEHYLRIILAAAGQMSHSVRRDENSEQECDEINAEGAKRDDVDCDKVVSQTRQQKNINGHQTKARNGRSGDGVDVGYSSDEKIDQQNCIPEESTEVVRKLRRPSRRRVMRPQEEPSLGFSQTVAEISENSNELVEAVSEEKTDTLPLLGEGVQRKPRRRRVTASPAEGNV